MTMKHYFVSFEGDNLMRPAEVVKQEAMKPKRFSEPLSTTIYNGPITLEIVNIQ